jgi:hypothetical protein
MFKKEQFKLPFEVTVKDNTCTDLELGSTHFVTAIRNGLFVLDKTNKGYFRERFKWDERSILKVGDKVVIYKKPTIPTYFEIGHTGELYRFNDDDFTIMLIDGNCISQNIDAEAVIVIGRAGKTFASEEAGWNPYGLKEGNFYSKVTSDKKPRRIKEAQ